MNANHTPGSWRKGYNGKEDDNTVWAGELCVASCPSTAPESSSYLYIEHAIGNARLIASAPDLLAALEGLLNLHVRIVANSGSGLTIEQASHVNAEIESARAVIAQARGETK